MCSKVKKCEICEEPTTNTVVAGCGHNSYICDTCESECDMEGECAKCECDGMFSLADYAGVG